MNIGIILFQIFNSISAIYIYSILFEAFSAKKTFKLRNTIIFLLALTWSLVLILLPSNMIRSVLILLLIIILSFTYQYIWYKSLLLSLLIYCLPGFIEIIVALMLMLFGIETTSTQQYVFLIIGTIISKILTFTIVQFIRIKKHKLGNISVWYYCAFGTMSITSTLVAIILLDYIFLTKQFHMRILTIVSVWLLFFLNLLIFYVIDKINNLYIAEKELIISKQLIKEQKNYYETIINEQENLAKIHHDIKNSLSGILSQLNNNDYIGTRISIENMLDDVDLLKSAIISNDVALNTILTIKKNKANRQNIDFLFDEHITSRIFIDPIDLCVILGNALDNAIEACEKITTGKRMIEVFVLANNSNLILHIQNTVSEKITTDSIKTSKKNKNNHGFGIIRIRELTDKYSGDMDVFCDDNYFRINIVLLNECSFSSND